MVFFYFSAKLRDSLKKERLVCKFAEKPLSIQKEVPGHPGSGLVGAPKSTQVFQKTKSFEKP